MRPVLRTGIRGRLFLAFGSVAATTVAASLVAWISFGGLGDSLNRVISDTIPAVGLAARLAEEGGVITATAPALAASTDEQDRARAWSTLVKSLDDIVALLEAVEAPLIGSGDKAALRNLVTRLADNLGQLDEHVRRRFRFRLRNEELVNRLRWAHADFLDEVEPMVADASFRIGLAVERLDSDAAEFASRNNNATIDTETRKQAAVLRLNAAGNLAVGLIARAASLAEQDALSDTAFFLGEVESGIETDLRALASLPETLSLRQSLQDILAFAHGDGDLFALRRGELKALASGRALVQDNRRLVTELQNLITERIEAGNEASRRAAEDSRNSIQNGKILLLAAVGASLAFAVLVVWLYVGRNLVRRITSLDNAMRAIAAGDLTIEVPTGGSDEISDMATALSTFRDTLAETQAELIQAGKLAALGQLAAGVAHELNQPLAAIRSYAHNSRRMIELERTEDAVDNLTRVSGLVERMSSIVDHLRTLARRPSPQIERVDLSRIVEDALALLENRIRDDGIVVETEFAADARFVRGEAIRLEQVLINLLSNGIDAMKDAPERRLRIVAEQVAGLVTLAICDTGVGVPQEALTQVFDPFFTTKDVGDGLGLGLTISYNIVKDFGGSIKVASDAGAGATFTVMLSQA